MVHCLCLYRSLCGLHWLSGLMAIHQALTVLLFDSQKLEKVTAIAFGYLDGMLGRLGTFEQQHPHLDAFCRRTERREVADGRNSVLMATGDEL
jgi:rhamnosyltransferase